MSSPSVHDIFGSTEDVMSSSGLVADAIRPLYPHGGDTRVLMAFFAAKNAAQHTPIAAINKVIIDFVDVGTYRLRPEVGSCACDDAFTTFHQW